MTGKTIFFSLRTAVDSARGFDYARSGAYFVTICAKERECLFGEVVGSEMVLNGFGELAKAEWLQTSQIRPDVVIDDFIIMPNHLHGILFPRSGRGSVHRAPTSEQFGRPTSNSIPTIIRSFKATVTNRSTNCAAPRQTRLAKKLFRTGDPGRR
ncbi:hypothetical protein MJD09_26785 [bacterium]|nr:hypothetical protein [bacterium]